MRIVLFYFSGTGNTKLIAESLMKKFENFEDQVSDINLISLEQTDEIDNIADYIAPDTLFGFGFPVYKFTYPSNFEHLFEKIVALHRNSKFKKSIPFFSFCTYCRFPSNSLNHFAIRLQELNFIPIAQYKFKCPSNGIAAMKSPDSYEYRSVMYFEPKIQAKIKKFASEVLETYSKYNFNSNKQKSKKGLKIKKPHDNLILKIVEDIERVKYPELSISTELCTKCGLCMKNCPQQNFRLENGSIEIIDKYHCLHCLRCMQHCPAKAISFGDLTNGPMRYTPKIRRNFFTMSEQPPSMELKSIIRNQRKIVGKWRRQTLFYWIKNR